MRGAEALRALRFSLALLLPALAAAEAPTPTPLPPFSVAGGLQMHPGWKVSGLPAKYAVTTTRFEPIAMGSDTVLKVQSERSYGTLVRAWRGPAPATLQWRWRVDQPVRDANIATKAGDDSALKVCVMFDQPLADMPFVQRQTLRLAQAASDTPLPPATLCYLWDNRHPAGTLIRNAYTPRVRYLVLQGAESPTDQWQAQRRNPAQDFRQAFGDESQAVPPVLAVAVGADSDNTGGASLAYLTDLRWAP